MDPTLGCPGRVNGTRWEPTAGCGEREALNDPNPSETWSDDTRGRAKAPRCTPNKTERTLSRGGRPPCLWVLTDIGRCRRSSSSRVTLETSVCVCAFKLNHLPRKSGYTTFYQIGFGSQFTMRLITSAHEQQLDTVRLRVKQIPFQEHL